MVHGAGSLAAAVGLRPREPVSRPPVSDNRRVLPSSSLAQASRHCPLIDTQSSREAWASCCSRRFFPWPGASPACARVRSIARNCALDSSRKHRLASEELVDVEDPSLDPEAQAQQTQMISLLREMVDALPAACREVCEMRYGRELSTAETARRLGISVSNVATRLDRAVKMLKQCLDRRLRVSESPSGSVRCSAVVHLPGGKRSLDLSRLPKGE